MLVYYKLSEKFRKLLKRIRRSEHLKKIRKSEGGTRETGPGSYVSEAKTGVTKTKSEQPKLKPERLKPKPERLL